MPEDTACDSIAKRLQELEYRIHRGSREQVQVCRGLSVFAMAKWGLCC